MTVEMHAMSKEMKEMLEAVRNRTPYVVREQSKSLQVTRSQSATK